MISPRTSKLQKSRVSPDLYDPVRDLARVLVRDPVRGPARDLVRGPARDLSQSP